MSEPSIPPIPESSVPPAKKGLPVIAWVGIGCGGLIVVGIIALICVAVIFGSMWKDFVGEMEKNPAKATAMMVVKFDKDLEIVSADDEKQTVTIKVKSTGETMTLSAEDFENGKYPGLKPEDRSTGSPDN